MTSRTDNNINRVKQLVHVDRRLTVKMISEELSLAETQCGKFLLKTWKCTSCVRKWFQRFSLNTKNNKDSLFAKTLPSVWRLKDLLNSVVTGDETWVFECDPEIKRQSCKWKSYRFPRPVKGRKSKSKVKVMLIVFFDIQGIIYFEFLRQGQTVNQIVYKEILRHLIRSVRDKRQSLWEAHTWALHHDNAPAHTALSICQFLAERNIATLKHPPYFPDL